LQICTIDDILILTGGVAMYLPGTPGEIIGDLRTKMGWTKLKLSQTTGIPQSQLSRIENGKITHISGDILIKLAKTFNVSTDYILGLTTVRSPKNYDISELGLSENAVKAIVSKKIDVDILNQLLEHKNFPYLIYMIKAYFDSSIADGITARNDIINMATSTLADFMKDNPERKSEVQQDIRLLKSQKLDNHEAELDKIKNTFVAILKDIKKNINREPPQALTAEMFKGMKNELSDKPISKITTDDISNVVMNMLQQAIPMNKDNSESMKDIIKNILETK
jgi:transcriptional regulator with XRE-family HTH domain